jgi:hypothetical protein
VDYHSSDQYIAFAEAETGEFGERRLNHGDGEAKRFSWELALRGVSERVGMEATGYSSALRHIAKHLGRRRADLGSVVLQCFLCESERFGTRKPTAW